MSLLEVSDLRFRYGRATVLDGVDLVVEKGEVVTVVGPNGAGKSTLLGVLSGALRASGGGATLDGTDVTRLRQSRIVREGCVLVPEGRQVFSALSVADNLVLGGWVHRRTGKSETLREVYELFPRLEERSTQLAGTLSGGEQQMLAIGRAMMARPRLLLLDEPSLGLAPQVVTRIFEALGQLRDSGVTLLLVEQNAHAALGLADRGYLLSGGTVLASGTSAELTANPIVQHVYLGGTGGAETAESEEGQPAAASESE